MTLVCTSADPTAHYLETSRDSMLLEAMDVLPNPVDRQEPHSQVQEVRLSDTAVVKITDFLKGVWTRGTTLNTQIVSRRTLLIYSR